MTINEELQEEESDARLWVTHLDEAHKLGQRQMNSTMYICKTFIMLTKKVQWKHVPYSNNTNLLLNNKIWL